MNSQLFYNPPPETDKLELSLWTVSWQRVTNPILQTGIFTRWEISLVFLFLRLRLLLHRRAGKVLLQAHSISKHLQSLPHCDAVSQDQKDGMCCCLYLPATFVLFSLIYKSSNFIWKYTDPGKNTGKLLQIAFKTYFFYKFVQPHIYLDKDLWSPTILILFKKTLHFLFRSKRN